MHIHKLYIWLIVCNISIFAMVIIGAITRLTESGLSMVEWKPLIGAIPPLNKEEWIRVFDLYKQTPEFQKKNFWMGIDDFKSIFFWEWFHRLWGRLIGMIYGLPFIFFFFMRWLPKVYKLRLIVILVLGGLQGYMGWYMVQSGLVNMPAVSHYRLALHLALAFLIYSLIIWIVFDLRETIKGLQQIPDPKLYTFAWACLGMVILTIFWGAYTAGLDAGLVYNDTFPKMGLTWVPVEVWNSKPYWINFFEDHAGVQFIHRWLAIASAVAVSSFGFYCIKKQRKEIVFPLVIGFVFLQVGLGITTLLTGVNTVAAVLHQAGALILLSLVLCALHKLRPKLGVGTTLSPISSTPVK